MKQLLFKSKLIIASLSAAAIIGIVAVVVMLVSKDDEAYRTIKVIETVGEVNILKENEEYAAYAGMILEEGYELTTSEDSYVRLVLDDDKYVKIEEGSKIVFETLGLFGTNKTKIRIEKGAMTCEITKPLEEDDDFVINTPNAVLAVRGTFFRVDLNFDDNDLVKTNVTTYGGIVATQRVMSTGVHVGEEVNVNAGNKVIISQINESVDAEEFVENVIYETQSITVEDIPDEDLIDVYFAIINGHDMFVEIEEIQQALDIRDINIEEHISVYEKAEKVKETSAEDTKEKDTTTEDVTTEEVTTEEVTTEEVTTEETTTEETTSEETTTEEITIQNITTRVEETTSRAEETTTKVEETTTQLATEETTTLVEETTTLVEETTSKEEETTTEEPTTVHIHTEVSGSEANIHKKCSDCGEVIEDGAKHSYTSQVTKAATCTSKGEMTYTCTCGYKYTEEIDYLDHSSVDGGEEEIHAKCESCGEVLENGSFHNYDIQVTKIPSCSEYGIRTYTCDCNYSYTENIAMEAHEEVGGGEAGVHKKCNVCGEVIEDGAYHNLVKEETKAATCTEAGINTYSCNCGYSYTENVAALGHTKTDPNASTTTCIVCGEPWVDISETNFEDVTFRTKLGQFDINNDGCLIGEELTGITTVSVAGTTAMDGECKNLKGIELLTNVTQIDCSYNADLLSLDFSGNTKLYKLYCNNTGLQTINVSGCTGLSTFDFTNCSELIEMNVSNTTLTSLIINSNPKLETLNVDGAMINNVKVSGTKITTLQLNNMTQTSSVWIFDSPLQTVTINNSDLGNVTLDAISQLESVVATNSTMDGISVDDCAGLKTLSIPDTGANVSLNNTYQLETINIRGTRANSLLELLGTTYTALTTLDVSNCQSLNQLDVNGCTNLTSLAVSGCEYLTSVNASNTGISSLDMTGCTMLSGLNLNSTKISTMANVIAPAGCISYLNIGSDPSNDTNTVFNASDIGWFSSLTTLYIEKGKLSDTDWANIKASISLDNLNRLNLSGNNDTNAGSSGEYLTILDLSGFNYIWELGISDLTGVTEVDISNSKLISNIDTSGLTNLVTFNASNSGLIELIASENEKLETINVSGCTMLDYVKLNNPDKTYSLKEVDLTGCSALTKLSLDYCPQITSIDLSDAVNLTNLSLFGCTEITSVDLSNNTKLTSVVLNRSGVTSVNFAYNTELEDVALGQTGITSVDFTNNTKLKTVALFMTSITTLDLSGKANLNYVELAGCTSLATINLSNTAVETLMLMDCTSLTSINVTGATNANNSLEATITGTTIDDGYFTKSDGFTINLVTQ